MVTDFLILNTKFSADILANTEAWPSKMVCKYKKKEGEAALSAKLQHQDKKKKVIEIFCLLFTFQALGYIWTKFSSFLWNYGQ